MYDGQKAIVYDDFVGKVSLTGFLRALDRYPLLVGNKGGSVYAKWEYVFITSNLDPSQWWPGCSVMHREALERRFTKVIYF